MLNQLLLPPAPQASQSMLRQAQHEGKLAQHEGKLAQHEGKPAQHEGMLAQHEVIQIQQTQAPQTNSTSFP